MIAISTIGTNRNPRDYTSEFYKQDMFRHFEYMGGEDIYLQELMSVVSICLQNRLDTTNTSYSLTSKNNAESYLSFLSQVAELAIVKKCKNIVLGLTLPQEDAFNQHLSVCKDEQPPQKIQTLLEKHNKTVVPFLNNACRSLFHICKKYPMLDFCLLPARTFYEIPMYPHELEWILEDVKCSNLKYWHNTGSCHILEKLGISEHENWLETHGSRLKGVHLEDVVAFESFFPPGMGEVPFQIVKPYLKSNTVKIFRIAEQYGFFGIKTARSNIGL